MNFLAHLFLAGPPAAPGYPDRLVGQFIADAVPGRRLDAYGPGVQAGIRQHRAIDAFTDQHPVVRRATARLRLAGHGKYAGVVSDVFFDHFLARRFEQFSTETLPDFTHRVYAQLGARQAEFPARVQQFFPHLVQHNWLLHYAEIDGVARTLAGLSRRAAPGSGMAAGPVELLANYAAYEADFQEFFPLLVSSFI
ncbi:ACP phosphodiesterase [Hymenobacter caeli]|uniref:Acyl carrier protein phosphodiesterase n=1 Tax=Hymenobacter caeli TaxID=2735894 RepID=A0ABX2FUZ2_9BACT|nr:acyl carrier protein phosphodiesterase [Hymenobacter caeli]NRT21010.1 acyl carrier protein phosphodiesterase [Hymenobacter caeli]